MMGFWQLVDSVGEVKAQRQGPEAQWFKDYLVSGVWMLTNELTVRFEQHSNYVHPYKFFQPLLNGTPVRLYAEIASCELELLTLSKVEVPVECVEERLKLTVFENGWSAFSDVGWVGTSEY